MVVGQTGGLGAAVHKHAVVEHKHAVALVPVLLQPMVVSTVQEVARSPKHATTTRVHVCLKIR